MHDSLVQAYSQLLGRPLRAAIGCWKGRLGGDIAVVFSAWCVEQGDCLSMGDGTQHLGGAGCRSRRLGAAPALMYKSSRQDAGSPIFPARSLSPKNTLSTSRIPANDAQIYHRYVSDAMYQLVRRRRLTRGVTNSYSTLR